ncbi:hypothetical protein AAFF_G00020280 [Aldrovandia affinis]|uniref:Secreted protein n=1 Tax=Aldrovandia affinis TaxID=143900 RepID=A0AAD7WGE8_9TELE|nr:hypothetical protein AAFF_G00020280 [Aldrovandia affinis]
MHYISITFQAVILLALLGWLPGYGTPLCHTTLISNGHLARRERSKKKDKGRFKSRTGSAEAQPASRRVTCGPHCGAGATRPSDRIRISAPRRSKTGLPLKSIQTALASLDRSPGHGAAGATRNSVVRPNQLSTAPTKNMFAELGKVPNHRRR